MCLDSWNDVVIYSSRNAMAYSNLDFKVSTCDPNNIQNIKCEKDPKII